MFDYRMYYTILIIQTSPTLEAGLEVLLSDIPRWHWKSEIHHYHHWCP